MQLLTTWQGFWQEIGEGIRDFFNPDLTGTTTIQFGSGAMVNLRVIIFGLFFGVLAAAFYAVYTNRVLGLLVRKLLSEEIFTPEQGKTLKELGLDKNLLVKMGLLNRYTLRRVVCSAERDCGSPGATDGKAVAKTPVRIPIAEEHFYIPREDKYTAAMRFRKNGNGAPTLLFVFFVSLLCVVILFALLPEIIAFFDNVLSQFSTAGHTYTGN